MARLYMPRSQLKTYLYVAKTLKESGPQTFDQITSLLQTSATSLEKYLDFLAKEDMIKKETALTGDTYLIAASGIKLLDFFKV